jgi:flagellar basal-body rod modification protein FlgD
MASVSGVGMFAPKAESAEETKKPANDPMANKETFLRLLVAQLKNQDPLKPMDGMQFVSQLAQFSQLEQLLSIRQGIDELAGKTPAATTGTETGTQG